MKRPHTTISILCLCLLGSLHAAKPDRIVSYKSVGETELTLHIFNPPNHSADDQRPAIVFFFGGGWVGGAPGQFYRQSEYLASRGMVAICADYRTQRSHDTSPIECVKDGKSAMRWVRSHAAELGINPDKLAAGGGSAGGQIAAATATTSQFNEAGEDSSVSCIPNALVLFNPVFDNGPGSFGHDKVKDYWQDFSPMHNLQAHTPPTIVFLGTEDKYIPVATAEIYKQRMEELGLRCDLHLYEDQPHGFFNKAKYKETVLEMDRFLSSLGYLEGE